jgi:prepilin-type N-terminal cleavage/methylation domain-containing protein
MTSLRSSSAKRGFTIPEVLTVVGIFSLLAGLGLIMSMETYRGSSFRSERTTIVSALERARGRAMNNMYQMPHGVYFDTATPAYVIFRGSSYVAGSSTNEVLPASSSAVVTGPSSVVFNQLDGTTSSSTITFTQDGKNGTISINSEGRINW